MIRQSASLASTQSQASSFAGEARQLLRRRKVAYVALVAVTAGAYLYLMTNSSITASSPVTRTAGAKVQSDRSATVSSTDNQASASTNVSDNATSPSASSSSTSQTTVTVNGQNIVVPANGSLSTTVNGGDSNTSVHVSHSSSSSDSTQQNNFTMEVNQ